MTKLYEGKVPIYVEQKITQTDLRVSDILSNFIELETEMKENE